jgi:hypothetical protein
MTHNQRHTVCDSEWQYHVWQYETWLALQYNNRDQLIGQRVMLPKAPHTQPRFGAGAGKESAFSRPALRGWPSHWPFHHTY